METLQVQSIRAREQPSSLPRSPVHPSQGGGKAPPLAETLPGGAASEPGVTRTRLCVTGLRGIPDVMGGVETHCEELLPRIAALAPHLEIEVLARKPYVDEDHYRFKTIEVTALYSPNSASWEAIVSTFLSVVHAYRKRASLIHFHAIGPSLLAPLARLLNLKVVMTHHGADYNRAKWGFLAKMILKAGEGWGVHAAHRVIAVSPSLADYLRERFPRDREKICYIPNGAPELALSDRSAAEVLAEFGLAPRQFIVTVGRLVPEKGFDYLIEAFLRSGTDRKLVIVGAADHDSEFAREVLATASDKVIFTGKQPRSTLRHLYEQADLFALPSFHEGLPISALEAGHCGVPMLLSNIQPNRDVGLPEHNYFPVGNVEALAEQLRRPGEAFAIRSADFQQRFDWSKIAQQTLEVYSDVLAG